MKSILLITGVSGRIGAAAAKKFSDQFQVVGLDIIPPKENLSNVDFIIADISNKESVKKTLEEIKEKYGDRIASFIHLAAYYNFQGGNWDKYQKITIDGTRNLLEGLQNFQLDQFVFSSTLLVYAPCKVGEKISENSKVEPKWEYPLSKIKTEKIIDEKQGNASSVILRIAGIYNDDCNSIPISQQIYRIYQKQLESHLFPGNLHHGSSFLHMDDLIQALEKVVEMRRELAKQELFVLGEPEVMSYGDLQKEIGLLLYSKPWWTIRIPKWVAKMGAFIEEKLLGKKSFIKPWMIDLADDHFDVDIRKAKSLLRWEPVHYLKNSLPKMIQKLKTDPQKWMKDHGL